MGVLFFDAGQILNDDEDWGDQGSEEGGTSLKTATGVEVRWLSPMGPLRLVWGYNLDPTLAKTNPVWDFSVGGNF